VIHDAYAVNDSRRSNGGEADDELEDETDEECAEGEQGIHAEEPLSVAGGAVVGPVGQPPVASGHGGCRRDVQR
jgi:hypothetical protein